MPLISSNRLLFLAPRRRRYEDVETAALDLALDVAAAPARMLTAEAGALVDDIDQVIALEDRPTPLGSDLAFEAEVAELSDYPCIVKLPSVSLIIPTLNEEANIGWVLQRVPACVDEIIVVDGGSTDRTVEVARTLRPDVVIVTELRRGKGVALRTGFAKATREVIVMIDADGSMDPAEIESYVLAVDQGYDLVKGSRATGGSTDLTPTRLLGNFCLRGLVNLLYSADFTELCYGFMALRRTSVPAMDLVADGFEIETEIVVNSLRRGMRIAEIPSHESERLNGVSHLHPVRDGLRVLSTIVRARFSRLQSDQTGTPSLAQDSIG
ncbi:MAG TPA: glycosyltransferase family 2 protein [Actinomycetota bacterium]